MSEHDDKNGPVFPNNARPFLGLSLRDLFACAALHALLSKDKGYEDVAALAYQYADKMLGQRPSAKPWQPIAPPPDTGGIAKKGL